MNTCIGHFTQYSVWDRNDFAEKMRQGMSFDEYMEAEKKAGLRVAVRPGQGGKNRYVVYEYEVDGRHYYGVHTVAFSADIRHNMIGKECTVEYHPENPSIAQISSKDESRSGVAFNIASMALGILSGCFGLLVLPGLALGIAAIVCFAIGRKNYSDSPMKALSYLGLVFGILGIIGSLFIGVFYLVMGGAAILSGAM